VRRSRAWRRSAHPPHSDGWRHWHRWPFWPLWSDCASKRADREFHLGARRRILVTPAEPPRGVALIGQSAGLQNRRLGVRVPPPLPGDSVVVTFSRPVTQKL